MESEQIREHLSRRNAPQGDPSKDLKTALYLACCSKNIDLNNILNLGSLGLELGALGFSGDLSDISFEVLKENLESLVHDGALNEASPNIYTVNAPDGRELKGILKYDDTISDQGRYFMEAPDGHKLTADILNFKVMPGDEVSATITGPDSVTLKAVIALRQFVLGRLMNLSEGREQKFSLMVDEHALKSFTFNFASKAAIKDARAGDVIVAQILERRQSEAVVQTHQVVRSLGNLDGYILDAVIANDIPNIWPSGMKKSLGSISDNVRDEDRKGRRDLRELPLVTIDGEDARDFDDAVYAKKEGENWRLFVAIADVSYYVRHGSLLDTEALNRCNSVYFPNFVIPMLPEKLSNGICSLNPGVERLCMVCEMIIDNKGVTLDYSFYPAVMRSHARLTYTEAHQMITQGTAAYKEHEPRINDIKALNELYKILCKARLNRGAVNAESDEVHFIFNESLDITGIEPVIRNEAHMLIEECMIAANVCAARFVSDHSSACTLYRVHAKPPLNKLTSLQASLKGLKLALPGGDSPSSQDFANFLRKTADRPDAKFICELILRSMSKAVYSPDNIGHFGLALEKYAHFTSPIRRYPDLQLHRVIKYLLKKDMEAGLVHGDFHIDRMGEQTYSKEELIHLGERCTDREIAASKAEFEVDGKLKCTFLKNFLGYQTTGIISAVNNFGIFVYLEKFYISGMIYIANLETGTFIEFDQDNQRMVGQRRSYKVGDRLVVTIAAVNVDENKIDLMPYVPKKAGRRGKKQQDSGSEVAASLDAIDEIIGQKRAEKTGDVSTRLERSRIGEILDEFSRRKKPEEKDLEDLVKVTRGSYLDLVKHGRHKAKK